MFHLYKNSLTRASLLFSLVLLFAPAIAQALAVGDTLPTLSIADKGELTIDDNFKAWSSQASSKKTRLVIYMAARPSAEKQIKLLTTELKKIKKPAFDAVTVVNGSDVTLGASNWALRELQKNKKLYPDSTLVFDAQGKGLNQWQLQAKSAAIMVVNRQGKLSYFKQGAVDAADVRTILALLNK